MVICNTIVAKDALVNDSEKKFCSIGSCCLDPAIDINSLGTTHEDDISDLRDWVD